jgi:hypothetical protein
MLLCVLFLSLPISVTCTWAAPPVVIKVAPDVMEELSTLDPNIVFLTRAKNGIRSLKEINDRKGAVGMYGPGEMSIIIPQLLLRAGVKTTMTSHDESSAPFRVIGNAYHKRLFTEDPVLLLFVTYKDFTKTIVEKGGGVLIRFEATKN